MQRYVRSNCKREGFKAGTNLACLKKQACDRLAVITAISKHPGDVKQLLRKSGAHWSSRAGVIILELISIFNGFESHKTGQDRAGREGSRVSLSSQ